MASRLINFFFPFIHFMSLSTFLLSPLFLSHPFQLSILSSFLSPFHLLSPSIKTVPLTHSSISLFVQHLYFVLSLPLCSSLLTLYLFICHHSSTHVLAMARDHLAFPHMSAVTHWVFPKLDSNWRLLKYLQEICAGLDVFTKNKLLHLRVYFVIVNWYQNLLMFAFCSPVRFVPLNCYVRTHYITPHHTTPSPARNVVKFWISYNYAILAMKIQDMTFSSSCFKQRIFVMS